MISRLHSVGTSASVAFLFPFFWYYILVLIFCSNRVGSVV